MAYTPLSRLTVEKGPPRAKTDASLRAERQKTENEVAARLAVADAKVDQALQLARDRADRLLDAARSAADRSLPFGEQTGAAVALLLGQREGEDRALASERHQTDEQLGREARERRDDLAALLVLERQATDLHLGLERRSADETVASRDDFLAQASHDMRGLMAAQKIYLSLLAKETDDSERGRRLAAHVGALVKIDGQMDRLVCDLVDFGAMQAGKLRVALTTRGAGELLASAANVFEPVARERQQLLSVEPAAVDAKVSVDYARGVQVLGNLLSNAIKFTPSGGKIRVGFETTPDEVTFFVADTGPGVSLDQADHIFERFVGTGSSSQGLGLGLFIARRLVEAHGGRLWLDREASPGAVFRFTLRRAPVLGARG